MTRFKRLSSFIILVLFIATSLTAPVSAAVGPPPQESPEGLSFVQIKMTGDEYVVLQNNRLEDIADLSQFTLKAFNNVNPTASNATSSTQILPAIKLGQGERLLLSSAIRSTCGASLAGKLSISLVDGGGILQIMTASQEIVDSVSWSSTTNGDIQSVPSNSKAPLAAYYRIATGDESYGWQLAEHENAGSCVLKVAAQDDVGQTEIDTDVAAEDSDNWFEIVGLSNEVPVTNDETSNDMLAPVITELLPNPSGTGNDSTDEFIEIYNPNNADYDLSGFKLQSGVTTLRSYVFKAGTTLPPLSYTAYYASETGLSLSNTMSQVRLFDDSGKAVNETGIYKSAKDGQSWMLLNGGWVWSLTATPDKLNIETKPATSNKAAGKAATTKKTPKKPAVKKPKAEKPKKVKTTTASQYGTLPTAETVMSQPVQTKVVALVGTIALLYGAYEYRADLANGFYKLRGKLGFSRPNRS